MVALLRKKPLLASDEVRALAALHGVEASKSSIDHMADKYAELSGDTPVDNDVRQLCVNLVRAKVIDKSQSMAFLIRHLKGE